MENAALVRVLDNAVVFAGLRNDPVVAALTVLLGQNAAVYHNAFSLCCDIARALYPTGGSLTDYLFGLLCREDNFYIESLASGRPVPEETENQAQAELRALGAAASFSGEYFAKAYKLPSPYPAWRAESCDMAARFSAFAENARNTGYGIFASHHVFTVSETGALTPVNNPDAQSLDELFGYEAERAAVLSNTRALLCGLPANNVLLYGDAGTGKSSTVKAVANEYAKQGLRLIQVEKSQLRHISSLLDDLASKPLSFIIFIDDLSFEKDDRNFTALKTVLEGSACARARNTVIYATSNRRHLIRESVEARAGDEVHLGDTLEEAASLAARFGIVLTYLRPDKDDYLELVRSFARLYGLSMPADELISRAESYAIRAGGRSPRAAKQFAEYLLSAGK
jgi:predicted AAA+ superfamily ATPase